MCSLPAGMGAGDQLAAVDSFLGWASYCQRLQRLELLELCAHALAQHLELAQSRWGQSQGLV
jgi:hypothetical protein